LDKFLGEGVDIVLDFEKKKIKKIIGLKSIFVNNLLEHVAYPEAVAKKIEELIPSGGYIFVSCPYKYPYHPSPIDNMFRPTPSQLALLFPKCNVVAYDIVYGETLLDALSKSDGFKIPSIKYWHSILSHLTFINRKFAVSCLVLEKMTEKEITKLR
jgi:hypothetical protein